MAVPTTPAARALAWEALKDWFARNPNPLLDLAQGPDRTIFGRFHSGGFVGRNPRNVNDYYGKFSFPSRRNRFARPDMSTMRDDIRRAEEEYAKANMIQMVDLGYVITSREIVLTQSV